MPVEVRKLRAGDIRRLAPVIGAELGSLTGLTKKGENGEEADPVEVGMALFERVLTKHSDTLWSWLADMAGMTADELDEAPLETPVDIVREIQQRGEFRPLLDALFSRTEKDGSGSTTE